MTEEPNEWKRMIERRLTALEAKVGAAPQGHQGQTRPASPREFLISKPGIKSLADVGLVAGYYIEIMSGRDSFELDDLNQFYSDAKEPRPKAYRDIPYQNVKRGMFRQVGMMVQSRTAHNRWALTNRGISRVENDLGKARL